MTAIHEGEGVFFIGNSFTTFSGGDVFVVGSNVPHLIKNNQPGVYSVSLFFRGDSFGDGFFDLPELESIKDFLNESGRGVKLSGELKKIIHGQISECRKLEKVALFRQLLSVLEGLSKVNTSNFVNENPFIRKIKERDGQRLNKVFQHSIEHLSEKIDLETVAALANLSVSQFCRYFKLHTRKTYFQFLNELRIEAACNSLFGKDKSIAQIGFEVGFNNLSNFNRQFKKIKGITPSKFRNAFLDKGSKI